MKNWNLAAHKAARALGQILLSWEVMRPEELALASQTAVLCSRTARREEPALARRPTQSRAAAPENVRE